MFFSFYEVTVRTSSDTIQRLNLSLNPRTGQYLLSVTRNKTLR